jgi:hypothetical protein
MINARYGMGDGFGVLEFVTNSVQNRAAHYRERASHLRAMAVAEPIGRLRESLTELAQQFEDLADSLVKGRRA